MKEEADLKIYLALIPAEIATEESAIGDVTLDADFVAEIERRAVSAYRTRVLSDVYAAHLAVPSHYNAAQKMAWADATRSLYQAAERVSILDHAESKS